MVNCIICKKEVKYSGDTKDFFKHMSNHAEENKELKTHRKERNPQPLTLTDPNPDPDAEAFQSSNIQVDNGGENNILVIFSINYY